MKLEDTVTIIPWQKPALMPSYLKKAHVGLLPLQDSFFNRYLTFPLKSMDYIAGGLPVVATSLPTMENIFHHNVDSILLENFETKEFRRTLENLRNNEKLYHGLRENVKILADQFSWKKRAEKMVEILDKKMWHKICI
jgi:glycosyltransferase involved in cell wall biosynthesis